MSDTWWRDVDDLVKEQADLLDVPMNQNLLIKGPPGSGKTNLLLLRANQLYLGDFPNLHVVVFGSLLKQFIQIGGKQYKFPPEKIITHTRLFETILSEYGASFDSNGMSLEEARSERARRVDDLLKSGDLVVQFDALLLDEAQDYTPLEIEILRSLTEVMIATADSRQKIYDVDDCMAVLEGVTDRVHQLTYHFRTGRKICQLADGIQKRNADYVSMLEYSQYNEADYPSNVQTKDNLDLEKQAEAIVLQINDQMFAYPDDLIGVLCPLNESMDAIEDILIKNGLGEYTTRANQSERFDPSKKIWLSTLTAAKGLEFRAVHVAGLEKLHYMRGAQRRLIFTGVTRARTALTLYWDSSIPGYLQSALRAVFPSQKPVTTQNIFGKS